MLDINQRNKKIFHLIESTIRDFCKILGTSYASNKEAILVEYENEHLFYVHPEFNKNNFTITINCLVYTNLPISKTSKLKSIYKSEEIADYIKDADIDLWFLNDQSLVITYLAELEYSNYAILKSQLLLDIYINVQNARRLKDKLDALLVELELVSAN